MNITQPYLFRGEIPSPKPSPKRGNQRWPRLSMPKLAQWAPWVLLGVMLYGGLFWALDHVNQLTISKHLVALVGVIVIAACLELASWVRDGQLPLALIPRMGLGGLLALIITLL